MNSAALIVALLTLPLMALPSLAQDPCCATGDLGLVVERATGSLLGIDRSDRASVGRITGLGDLSHASLTYSPDERFAYVFGRDGGLTKVDMVTQSIVARTLQAGNSIGGQSRTMAA
jgi:protein NirF